MIFNQLEFLFLFLPIILIVFFVFLRGGARIWFLGAGSIFFYAVSGIEHGIILIVDILWVYLVTRHPAYRRSPVWLIAAILPPILALIYYKYTGFVLETVGLGGNGNDVAPGFSFFENIVLPAGISFFTFQLMSFAIDRHKGSAHTDLDFKTFALYVSFFPQLVAGPIVRPVEVADRLRALTSYRFDSATATRGLGYIVFGLAWKVLLADSLARSIAPMLAQPDALGSLSAAFVVLCYSFQIYFDFYGYSLIAIGLALLFGVQLPDNFRRPYAALNPRDFWRRWHITLSYWIRDYLYLPLGGNKAYARNILITFAICGLWHGAAWTFVVWGLYHGALVAGYRFAAPIWDRMPTLLQRVATFTLVSLGWTLFIFDFETLQVFMTSLVSFDVAQDPALIPNLEGWIILGVGALCCYGVWPERIAAIELSPGSGAVFGIAMAGLFFATLLFVGQSTSFIYFRF